MQLRIHGARGSTPVSGDEYARYGGHTTCFEVAQDGGPCIVIDAGSGLLSLAAARAAREGPSPFEAAFFLTHFHWDHIQGLPFFPPLYDRNSTIRFLAHPPEGRTVETGLTGAIAPPWFPVPISEAGATLRFETLTDRPVRVGAVEVSAVRLWHPGGVTGFRLRHPGGTLAIATDVETGDAEGDRALLALATGAQVLIHDAQYTPRERETTRRGWGHSTWEDATELAREAGVERLILTSHDPARGDREVDEIVERARARFPNTDAASEGRSIDF